MACCKTILEGTDVPEMMATGAEHAKKEHGVTTIPLDLAKYSGS